MVNGSVAQKAFSSEIAAAVRRSVIKPQRATIWPSENGGAVVGDGLLWVAAAADGMIPWGVNPSGRDRQLRAFYPTESVLQSAISSMVARNMAFTWTLDGPPRTVNRVFDVLHASNSGRGWMNLIGQVSTDLYTQDKGAFIEVVRIGDSELSPVVGLNHLDAGRCYHTGDPEIPVLYRDREDRYHELRWWEVITLAEMPAPHELYYGLQFSAMTRVLKAAQIFRNIEIYRDEKTGGRHTRALHLVGGVEASKIRAALDNLNADNDRAGLSRFSMVPIVTALDPEHPPSVATLELAGLPENFDAEQAFKEYVTILAMGLFVDVQELAPLPGGGLGSGAQSSILHLKTQGKGPALFMKLLEHKLNFAGAIPDNVTFRFEERDVEAEQANAEVGKTRAETRQLNVATGVLDAQGARQLAVDDGDIPQELFDVMAARDATTDLTGPAPISDSDRVRADGEPQTTAAGDATLNSTSGAKAARAVTFGEAITSRLHRAYATTSDDANALGYFGTLEDRLAVAGAIGPALQKFEADLRAAGVWEIEISAEDADRLFEASTKELVPKTDEARRAGPDAERLDLEADAATSFARVLRRVRKNVEERIGADGGAV